jgi:hypothetical protein
MSKKIKFTAIDSWGYDVCPRPYPASKSIPKWWRDAETYQSKEQKFDIKNGHPNFTFKKCLPMLDAISAGYIVPLWADVKITAINDELFSIDWATSKPVFSFIGVDAKGIEAPDGYYESPVRFLNTWIPKTPPGYSVTVTSPVGYKNLPFKAVTGVLDSDRSTLELSQAMWVKKDFNGIVEKGTPMFQVIPFKRENWDSEFDYYKDGEFLKVQDKNFRGTMIGHYLKNVWSQKKYN